MRPTASPSDFTDPNPGGLCGCGCGQQTSVIKQNSFTKGLVAGHHRRWVAGHQKRLGPDDYSVDPATGCWIWQRKLGPEGYGRTKRKYGGSEVAHRYVYWQLVGDVPEGLELDHLCRNRACVNPDHLEPVPRAENVRRGNATKLTRDQVAEIKAHPEIPSVEFARRFGVGASTVWSIRAGRSWKDVEAA